MNSDAALAGSRTLRLVNRWRSRIVLSLLVVIRCAVMLWLLALYPVAASRLPLPLAFLVAMTALLLSTAVLASLSR